MKSEYSEYAKSRLEGNFGAMSSWRFVAPFLRGKKVLDIGCSDGLYLSQLSRDSWGIEQVSALAGAAKRRGMNVITGDILPSMMAFDSGAFDGVLFSHVLEHVDNPVAVLRESQRVLKAEGTLILGLPIERNIFRDLLRMDYFAGTHLYAFSVRNARKLLEESGFRVEKMFFHLPKCRAGMGRMLESVWNKIAWPFREYLSMAYWIVATRK